MEKQFWENGQRVQVEYPKFEESEVNKIDSPALVMTRRLLGLLKGSENQPLEIDCMCLVTGICYTGSSMADIAKKHNVTRATVSKRCVDLIEDIGIEPTRAMRTRIGQENCRKARVKTICKEIKNFHEKV